MENPDNQTEHNQIEEEQEEDLTFEELGLDARLTRALLKKGILKPTPIQRVAIPLVLQGKDVVARAKTGSGKTFAYLAPLLQKLFASDASSRSSKLAPSAFVLVPTRELCQQVYAEVLSLIELCRVQLKVAQLTSSMSRSELRNALAGPPDILISTPACIPKCMSSGVLQSTSVSSSLEILVLDEADLLLSYGYEDDIKALTPHIPKHCQCLLMSATSSADVEKLKKLILHNPFILTLPEVGDVKDDAIPKNVQQFWNGYLFPVFTEKKGVDEVYSTVSTLADGTKIDIRVISLLYFAIFGLLYVVLQKWYCVAEMIPCNARDKLLYTLSLLKLELVLKKFGIKSAVLNAELPQNSRLHILEEFNAGLFDYLIATDDSEAKEKEEVNGESNTKQKNSRKHAKQKLDSEFGVVRGIDFKNVYTVINFEMPQSCSGYVHRIGRTGRAFNTGMSISLVSPEEMEILDEIKSFLGDDGNKEKNVIAPFSSLQNNAVEALRYRAEDVAKSVTKIAVRESRAQDLRNEILNSEKLKVHFESNPGDLDLLKHDKVLSKKPPAPHLRDVPEYLVDPTTREASKAIKLASAAMGNANSKRHHGSKKIFRRNKDPLKTFSAEVF
ncbi:hypothetical protein TIFTF001_023469 [Ficus carica]|uniref:RNA helicase n=1 Tax=Ficus carica TaxID=3494 RepID=A0AA88AKZ5_FICCA|nr:hypothetical protein TIFTF001_023469 [Ficus carica]